MRGLWGNFWVMAIVSGLLLFIGSVAASVLPIFVTASSHYGLLDFAGGSVIGVNWPGPFAFGSVVWLAAEFMSWRSRTIIPLGSILLFVVSFVVAINVLASAVYAVYASPLGTVILWLLTMGTAAAIAIIPAGIYYRLKHSKRLVKTPDVF